MPNLITKAIEYLGIGLVFLGVIIVYGTLHANAFNGYILGTGVLLIAIPVIVLPGS